MAGGDGPLHRHQGKAADRVVQDAIGDCGCHSVSRFDLLMNGLPFLVDEGARGGENLPSKEFLLR